MIRVLSLSFAVFCFAALTFSAAADEVVTNWDIQAVDANGAATNEYVGSNTKVILTGVVLNKAADMLDGTADNGTFMGGQWQVFIQGIDGDHAGTALWMGQNYGRVGGDANYTAEVWNEEIYRLNNVNMIGQTGTNHPLAVGDVVQVTGYAMFRPGYGKTNINERHSTNSYWDFTIEWTGENRLNTLTPEAITLSDLQVAGADPTYPMFDATRESGAEYYQGTLVKIEGVTFDGGTWGKDETLTITDGTYTLDCKLGISDDFLQANLLDNDNGFDVIGILDQEDGNRDGYRIWVMGYDGSTETLGVVPEPATFSMLTLGGLVSPALRELKEIVYQFDRPFEVDCRRIADRLGLVATPFETAITATRQAYGLRRPGPAPGRPVAARPRAAGEPR
jgi:hypothetical protein